MPRVSAAAQAIAVPIPVAKLEPPPELGAEAAAMWRGIVDRLPADWLSADHGPLLEQFCNHATYARWLAAKIDKALQGGLSDSKALGQLLKLHALESERLTSLAIRLRLSPQANRLPHQQAVNAKKNYTPGPRPWESWRQAQADRTDA